MILAKCRSIAGIALAQLRHYRRRTGLAVLGVGLAVVLMVLLVGLGHGVTDAGASALSWIDRDLWMTAGVQFTPGAVGGVQNQLYDAHEVTREVAERPEVASAGALAFQSVYASANGSEFETLVAVGGTGNGSRLNIRAGSRFSTGDRHYANGSYDGPWSGEVIIDERTAALLNVSVGEEVHVGGTIASAREHAFEVVGISPTFSTFLGTATVTLHLSELQALTGKTANDPASIVAITLEPGADPEAVEADLEREYPYAVRTNREQLRAFLGNSAGAVAAAVTLAILAVLTGLALVVNVLATLVRHQRRELAALRATGVSTRSLVAVVLVQGLGIGLGGAVLGMAASPLLAAGLNGVVADLTGFRKLVRTPLWLVAGGGGLALSIGLLGAAVAALGLARTTPLRHLRDEA